MMTLLLSTAFYSRSTVVTSLINNYLVQHNSQISCIDFHLNGHLDIVISRLCIDSPYAEVELLDTLIEWRFDSGQIQDETLANSLSHVISAVNISSAIVIAKDHAQFPNVQASSSTKASVLKSRDLPSFIRQNLQEFLQLSTSITVNINNYNYQAYTHPNTSVVLPYQGSLSVNNQSASFSLINAKKEDVFSFEVSKKRNSINADVAVEFSKTTVFLNQHQALLPLALTPLITKNSNETWPLTGVFRSQLIWQDKILSMTNQLENFSFQIEGDVTHYGAINIASELAWKTSLAGEVLHIDFAKDNFTKGNFTKGKNSKKNRIQLSFEPSVLITQLTTKDENSTLTTFLNNNMMDRISMEPLGEITLDFSKQKIKSDGLNITSRTPSTPLTLSLNNLTFSYDDELAGINLQHGNFAFAGHVNLAQLKPFSLQPLTFSLAGEIVQLDDFWQVALTPTTIFELTQVTIPENIPKTEQENISKNKQLLKPENKLLIGADKAKRKIHASAKKLLSAWQGSIIVDKDITKNNYDVAVRFDLQSTHQINQLKIPETIQLETLELAVKLSGNLDDIRVNADILTDKVPVASAMLRGNIQQPTIEVSAKELLISDLLGLKLQLPFEMKLIDGTLSYHLSGQLQDRGNLMANVLNMDISIKDMTGEIEGTWLQALNWQQAFVLENGKIKSITDESTRGNNLTIAKVESASPITHLSTQILFDFSDEALSMHLKNSHGKILGGRFDIPQAQWPITQLTPINVKLTKIDLEKLLELDKKQGIVVTGRVSGQLPFYFDGEHFLIDEGNLYNVGNGLIQVYNNPAVEELKRGNTELKLAFNALENLHYHHLSSVVSMADDGYMQLNTSIKGRNPDLDNDVNLNLNLSYDLLGLLESLNITEHFESKVIKGISK